MNNDKQIRKWILDYRRIMKDEVTPEETVVMRIIYLQGICSRAIDEVLWQECTKRDSV